MGTAAVKYYSGDVELNAPFGLDSARFAAIGGSPNKHNRYDSFKRLAGYVVDGPKAVMPVTRKVFYKANPSLHKCDARCLSATGHNCECSCGGKNHGAAA